MSIDFSQTSFGLKIFSMITFQKLYRINNTANVGPNFSPHRMCVNRDKIDFATKQRKLQLNRFCNKTAQIPSMPWQNSVNYIIIIFYSKHIKFHQSKISPHLKYLRISDIYTSKISPHIEFLHMTQNFLHGHCLRRPRQI